MSPPEKEYYVSLVNWGEKGEKGEKKEEEPRESSNERSVHAIRQQPSPDSSQDNPVVQPEQREEQIGIGGEQALPLDKSEMNALFTGGGARVYEMRSQEGRRQGIQKYGGSEGSESCVEAGLQWLARHQDPDGKWSANEFHRHCKGAKCSGVGYKKYTPALTALSFMSFLGAGYTHRSGPYRDHLQKTRAYLLGTQDRQGYFGEEEMYNHAIVMMAMLEVYGQTKDWELGAPIRRGILATCRAQQSNGGWTYQAKPSQERNDTSVTGWQILSLHAAKRLGFGVPQKTMERAWDHFQRHTLPSGEIRYADRGPQAYRKTDALISVGLLCGLLLGKQGTVQKNQIRIVQKNLPEWEKANSMDHGMYYWYHGTLAMFLVGGKAWAVWNERLRPMLIAHQIKEGCEKGSWPPIDKWNSAGGRIYSTTINILILEIYYRYRPSFLFQE